MASLKKRWVLWGCKRSKKETLVALVVPALRVFDLAHSRGE